MAAHGLNWFEGFKATAYLCEGHDDCLSTSCQGVEVVVDCKCSCCEPHCGNARVLCSVRSFMQTWSTWPHLSNQVAGACSSQGDVPKYLRHGTRKRTQARATMNGVSK